MSTDRQAPITSITTAQVRMFGQQMVATRIHTDRTDEAAEDAVLLYAETLRSNGDSPFVSLGLSYHDGFTAIVYTLEEVL